MPNQEAEDLCRLGSRAPSSDVAPPLLDPVPVLPVVVDEVSDRPSPATEARRRTPAAVPAARRPPGWYQSPPRPRGATPPSWGTQDPPVAETAMLNRPDNLRCYMVHRTVPVLDPPVRYCQRDYRRLQPLPYFPHLNDHFHIRRYRLGSGLWLISEHSFF